MPVLHAAALWTGLAPEELELQVKGVYAPFQAVQSRKAQYMFRE